MILSTLRVGDNPYLANNGINRKNIIGGNVSLINLPLLVRQMTANFSTDDTIKSFVISDVQRASDALMIIFTVTSVLGDISQFKHKLSN